MIALDENEKHKLDVRSFVSNRGYKSFKEDIGGLVETFNCEIDMILRSQIGMEDLSKLNFNLGVKSGLAKVLLVLEAYEEEASQE